MPVIAASPAAPRARSRHRVATALASALVATFFVASAASAGEQTAALAAADVPVYGCQTTSEFYPWGKDDLRTWTPNNAQPGAGTSGNSGIAQGEPFDARLVRANGRNSGVGREMLLLEDDGGCRHLYPAASFNDVDRAFTAARRAEHPTPADPNTYDLFVDPRYVTAEEAASGAALSHETQHFAIWYGQDTAAASYRIQADRGIEWDEGITNLGTYMEEVYAELRDINGARMPYADSDVKLKTNIYICGTGMPWDDGDQLDCGASAGADSIFVSALYILEGSTTMTHEFGHVLQMLSGGFVGPQQGLANAWEAHANWQSYALNPQYVSWYWQNLENGPAWFTNWYGWYPLMIMLNEDDRTRDYPWRAWRDNLRGANGWSTETFLETVVRLGIEDGIYPDGWNSFADEMGWYGARLAATDFTPGKVFRDGKTDVGDTSRYVGLVPGGAPGAFTSPADRPLWEFGTHIVPLRVAPGAETISVSLRGDQTEQDAAWRYTLVSVSDDGSPSYSELGSSAGRDGGTEVALPAQLGDEYYLAVTATPGSFVTMSNTDQPDPAAVSFPYEVRLQGAVSTLPGVGSCLGPYTQPDGASLNFNTGLTCATRGPALSFREDPRNVTRTGDETITLTAAVDSLDGATMTWQSAEPGATSWSDTGARGTSFVVPPATPSATAFRVLAADTAGATVVASQTATYTDARPINPMPIPAGGGGGTLVREPLPGAASVTGSVEVMRARPDALAATGWSQVSLTCMGLAIAAVVAGATLMTLRTTARHR